MNVLDNPSVNIFTHEQQQALETALRKYTQKVRVWIHIYIYVCVCVNKFERMSKMGNRKKIEVRHGVRKGKKYMIGFMLSTPSLSYRRRIDGILSRRMSPEKQRLSALRGDDYYIWNCGCLSLCI